MFWNQNFKIIKFLNNFVRCICNPFYQGEYCDKIKICNIEEYSKECNPSGTNKVKAYGPTCLCKCKVGYYGEKCEFKFDNDIYIVSRFLISLFTIF